MVREGAVHTEEGVSGKVQTLCGKHCRDLYKGEESPKASPYPCVPPLPILRIGPNEE